VVTVPDGFGDDDFGIERLELLPGEVAFSDQFLEGQCEGHMPSEHSAS
jgi:hypothetical protein